jgi:hypothetical protein
MSNEYNNNTSSSNNGAPYNSLGTYTQGYSMGVSAGGNPTTGSYVVPVFGSISYNSLSGSGSSSGYGSITSGYGNGAGQCQQTYTTSMCNASN